MRYQLALLALYCGTVAGQSLTDDASLTVVLRGERLPASVLQAMKRETQASVTAAGVHLTWTPPGMAVGEVSGEIAVIELRGGCAGPTLRTTASALHSGPEPMGQTHIANGKVLPFADVLCDAVGRLVGRDLRAARSSQRDELWGRALGRVLAHELYHILLRSEGHGSEGLSRPEQRSADLLAPANSFDENDERRIAGSLAADAIASGR